jgi:hypothetical protein
MREQNRSPSAGKRPCQRGDDATYDDNSEQQKRMRPSAVVDFWKAW